MPERTCSQCGEPSGGAKYCSQPCRSRASYERRRSDPAAWDRYLSRLRARYVPTGNPPGPKPVQSHCDECGCDGKHFAKGLCRRHYYRARWAAGLDGATSSSLILTSMASLYGTVTPKLKQVKCVVTVGLLVDCPWCGVVMAAHSNSGRTCPECSTTVELNPEEVSWVISEAHTTRQSALTA